MFLVLLISSKTLKKVYSFFSQIGQQILLWKKPRGKKIKTLQQTSSIKGNAFLYFFL